MARPPEGVRQRRGRAEAHVRSPRVAFKNPYPWMSEPEALVHLELERKNVPFSWRYFDGTLDEAPHVKELIPDFAPEFTLREYKTVIFVESAFFSGRYGVLDQTALAVALLEEDGWKAEVLWEADIRRDVKGLLEATFPALVNPVIKGKPKPNPFGPVEKFFTYRMKARNRAFARSKPKLEDRSARNRRRTGRARHRRGRRGSE